jgi:hypothetical protein
VPVSVTTVGAALQHGATPVVDARRDVWAS